MDMQNTGALVEIGSGSLSDMALRLDEMKQRIKLAQQFFKEVMDKDVDYGIIPGTEKPTLYQPGADKLCALYNYSKIIAEKTENKDYASGHYDVTVKVRLLHRGTGEIVAEGEGSCSTRESKYWYRWGYERDIPKGIDKELLVSKEFTNKKTNEKYYKYRIENEDLFSLWNTMLKMAIKRGFIGATLSGTGLSGLFSQEEDVLDAWIEGESGEGEQTKQKGNVKPQGTPDKKDLAVSVGFGKHKGKTLGDVLDEDPSYLDWLADKAQNEKVKAAAANILRAINNPPAPPQQSPQDQADSNQPGNDQAPPPSDDDALLNELFPGGEGK